MLTNRNFRFRAQLKNTINLHGRIIFRNFLPPESFLSLSICPLRHGEEALQERKTNSVTEYNIGNLVNIGNCSRKNLDEN